MGPYHTPTTTTTTTPAHPLQEFDLSEEDVKGAQLQLK